MVYVITEICLAACDTGCADVCPVDCIAGPLPLEEMHALTPEERTAQGLRLYIDPNQCICCGACAPECPVDAIFPEDELPAAHAGAAAENEAFFAAAATPPALPGDR